MQFDYQPNLGFIYFVAEMAISVENRALKKGAWSPEEDKKLIAYIKRYGIWNWAEMAKPAGKKKTQKLIAYVMIFVGFFFNGFVKL